MVRWRRGLSTIGRSCFGMVKLRGLNRVAYPPARINAFNLNDASRQLPSIILILG
jgi:hypothetical protein